VSKRLLFACVALSIVCIPGRVCAQFNDPRTYVNVPVVTNQLELNYAHVRANASIDTSLIVTGANFNLNVGTIDYKRYFGWLHRLTWVEATVPVAGLAGSISGTNVEGSVTGTGDSSYSIAMLLKGGPALTVEQFKDYKPTPTLGVSLTASAPTGSYQPGQLLNLGANRFSLKPEIALSYPFGPEKRWEYDTYANAYFYTDNTSFHGTQILRQRPLSGLEAHLSYSFTDNLWASLDTRYSFGGTTLVNAISQSNPQQNFILGNEVNLSVNSRNSFVLAFAKALVHQNGPAVVGFSVRYDYTWGKGYK
jgi:hypothetical protein